MSFELPLTLHSVMDAGVPNRERVAITVQAPVNAAEFGLMIGTSTTALDASPFSDFLFMFGAGQLLTGDWMYVYSGHGEPRVDSIQGVNTRLVSLYWGRSSTIFYNPNIVPILFRVAAYTTLPPPPVLRPLPQHPSSGASPVPTNALLGLLGGPTAPPSPSQYNRLLVELLRKQTDEK